MKVENLGFTYRRRGRQILNDLSFSTEASRIAVLGPNGAGKSTLLSILSSANTPSSGYFSAGGYDSRDRSGTRRYRARLGVVPQTATAFGGMTCREFLEYVSWLRDMPTALARTRVPEVIEAVGLSGTADRKLSTYSGGMRQRASLAQALVNEPALLLLDEPTVSLDPAQRDSYLALLRSIGAGTTIVMTSHVVDDVASFADDVVVVHHGSCRFAGSLAGFCGVPPGGGAVTGAQVKAAYLDLLAREDDL